MLANEGRGRTVNDAFTVPSKTVQLSEFISLLCLVFVLKTIQNFERMFKF